MAERFVPSRTAFVKLWQWIKNEIVQDVPAELAVCEFECQRTHCTVSHWRACELVGDKPRIDPAQFFPLIQ
jgi:hypothetical protein